MFFRIRAFCLCCAVAVTTATAQQPAERPVAAPSAASRGGAPGTVEAEPIACWWRTSAGAVRVGELFTLVLTCAVIETSTTTVVPDVSRLDPSVLQMPPFDVVDGRRETDLRTALRRFIQFNYTLKVINDDAMGKDVSIPTLIMSYKVQSRATEGAAAIEGRDRQYILPSLPIRVLSLVPAGATDIRDQPAGSFRDIDTRRFRANVFNVVAIALFALSAVLFAAPLVRGWRRRQAQTPSARRMVSDMAILRGVKRELSAIHDERGARGWSPEPVSRALAALRIAAGFALSRPASQAVFVPGGRIDSGQLLVYARRVGGGAALVSGSVTPEALAGAVTQGNLRGEQAARLGDLRTALSQLTTAAYGRSGILDTAALNAALASGRGEVERLVEENSWTARTLEAMRQKAAGLRRRVGIR